MLVGFGNMGQALAAGWLARGISAASIVTIDPGEDWWHSRHLQENRRKLKRHLLKLFEEELGGP